MDTYYKKTNKNLIQFSGEEGKIAGKNVIEAFDCYDDIIFNETYIVIGEGIRASKLEAMYDLTIIGNVQLDECSIHGSLTIIGNADIKKIECNNGLICKGSINSSKIFVGGNIIANSIICDEIICDGNISLETTINIDQNAQIGKNIVAYEGIIGSGKFKAENAVANEYFDFDGESEGNIIELDNVESDEANSIDVENTAEKLGDIVIKGLNDLNIPAKRDSIEDILDLLNDALKEENSKLPSLSEEDITNRLKNIGEKESKLVKNIPNNESLFSILTEISYQDKIETIDEYLSVLLAQECLPKELFEYESVEHIGKIFLPEADRNIELLSFTPLSIEHFSKTLAKAIVLKDKIKKWNIVLDTIFESIGIKYMTVESMIKKNKHQDDVEKAVTDIEENVEERDDIVVVADVINPEEVLEVKPAKISKTEFLSLKISHVWNKYNITSEERDRLTRAKVRTIGELIETSDTFLTEIFGKKAFLVNHLIVARDKLREKVENME